MREYAAKCDRYLRVGIWNITQIRQQVAAGKLTKEEYEQITGKPYATRSDAK